MCAPSSSSLGRSVSGWRLRWHLWHYIEEEWAISLRLHISCLSKPEGTKGSASSFFFLTLKNQWAKVSIFAPSSPYNFAANSRLVELAHVCLASWFSWMPMRQPLKLANSVAVCRLRRDKHKQWEEKISNSKPNHLFVTCARVTLSLSDTPFL